MEYDSYSTEEVILPPGQRLSEPEATLILPQQGGRKFFRELDAPQLPPGQAPPRKGSCPGGRPSLRARGSSEPEAGPEAATGLDFRIIPGSAP